MVLVLGWIEIINCKGGMICSIVSLNRTSGYRTLIHKKGGSMSRLFLLLFLLLFSSGCVYQNVTLNTTKMLEDGTEQEMTSRTINFAFSDHVPLLAL